MTYSGEFLRKFNSEKKQEKKQMISLNKVILIGNLTRDPELAKTKNDLSVCSFTLAVSRAVGEKDETLFIDVTAWNKTAEACAKFLSKGSCTFVEGYLQQHSFEDKNGNRRSMIKVVATTVKFVSGGGAKRGDNDGETPRRERQEQPRRGRRYDDDVLPPTREERPDSSGGLGEVDDVAPF